MKIFRYLFFLGVLGLGGQAALAQASFTVSGRKCIPEGDCGGDSTTFKAPTLTGARSWQWNFGDPTAGSKNTASGATVRHLYTQPNGYTVTLTVGRSGGRPDTTITRLVYINDLPPRFEFFNGKEDTTICPKTSIKLDPYEGVRGVDPTRYKYSWYPTGDTTQTILADKAKCYSVEVMNDSGCTRNDRITVKICGQNDQQQAAKWYFGANAGIKFDNGQASANTDGKVNTPEGVSAISDKQGALLFYTDGITIFDKDGKPMRWKTPADSIAAGGKLGGSGNSTQSALIVPQPSCRGCETVYYVFTTNDTTRQLSYSVVDMRGNRGKGAIVEANVPLHQPSTQRITSVQNPKDSTYWVVTRDSGSNAYRFYKVTKNGVVAGQVLNLGKPDTTAARQKGYIKFSNNGKKLAKVVPGPPTNYVEIYDFNDSTGAVKRPGVILNLGPAPPTAYGVEFSPDGKNIFVSFTGDGTVPSRLVRYNVEKMDSAAIALTKITIDSTAREKYGALQYAPDGKIYLAIDGSGSLGVINNPDSTSREGFDFVKNGLDLGGKKSQLGLPNFVQSIIQPPTGPGISYTDTCFGTPTQFQSGPICDPLKDKYEWDFGDGGKSTQQQATHLYARPGKYTVKLRQYNQCKDTTMTAQLTIIATPKIDLGKDLVQCRKSVTLDVGPGATGPDFQYLWLRNNRVIPGARGPKLTVDTTGEYVVIAANQGLCLDADTIKVTLTKPRPVNIGADTTLCPGQRVSLGSKTPQASGATFEWTNGTTSTSIGTGPTLSVSQAGTYVLTVTDRSQGNVECVNSDTLVVRSGKKPDINAVVQNAAGCQTNDGRITVNVILTDNNTGASYTWYKNGAEIPLTKNTPVLDNLGIGTYRVTLANFDANGIQTSCTLDTSFVVNARNPDIQVARDRLTNASCTQPNGGSITLRTVKGTPTTYVWRNSAGAVLPNATGPTITNVPAGTYSVDVSDANGCKFTLGNLILRQDPAKLVELGPDTTRCTGTSVTLDAGTLGDTYRWSTGATTRTIPVSQTGRYTVTVTDSRTGCSSSDTVNLRFNPKPTIVVGPAQSVCANAAPLQLAATPAGGTWSGPGVTPQGLFRPGQNLTGGVTLTYSVTQQGCADSARKAMTVQPIPDVNLGPDRSFCANAPQTLSVPEVPPATYRWSTGETTASITPKLTGTYSVSVALGTCRAADTVKVQILPAPILTMNKEVPLCSADRDTVTLDAGGLPTYTYRWNPGGQTTRRIKVDQLGTYTVRVSNVEGCTEERPVEVFDECAPRIIVPDIFTPNGDGVNDRLDVFVAHVSEFELRIYNRWGEMVFRTNDPSEKWDGSYKGMLYPTQSYAWLIAYKSAYFPERGVAYKRGAVLVAR
jgi:gliding motility-associated-like protein